MNGYLPFENSGVISEWQLQLPADPSKDEPAQFDYNTITDNANGDNPDSIKIDPAVDKLLSGKLTKMTNPTGEIRLFLDSNKLDDLWFLVTWSE